MHSGDRAFSFREVESPDQKSIKKIMKGSGGYEWMAMAAKVEMGMGINAICHI